MTYEELYNKYANRSLYEPFGGVINVYRDNNYKLDHINNCIIIADVWHIPNFIGWSNSKQKRQFLKDAKKLLSSNKSTKLEYYKIIDLV